MSWNVKLELAKNAALAELHAAGRELSAQEERMIDAFRAFAHELRGPMPEPPADEWNKRIEEAKRSLVEETESGPPTKVDLVHMLNTLRDPESAHEARLNFKCEECGCDESGAPWHIRVVDIGRHLTRIVCDACNRKIEADREYEGFVRHPGGPFWGVFTDGKPFKGSKNEDGISNGIKTLRPMSPDEAFRVGAVVEFTVAETGSIVETPVVEIFPARKYVKVELSPSNYYWPWIKDLTLVEPAPEEK